MTTDGPDLVLILPDGMTETCFVHDVAEALQGFRGTLQGKVSWLRRAAERATEDPLRHARLTAQAAAYSEAIEHLDETLTTTLDR